MTYNDHKTQQIMEHIGLWTASNAINLINVIYLRTKDNGNLN